MTSVSLCLFSQHAQQAICFLYLCSDCAHCRWGGGGLCSVLRNVTVVVVSCHRVGIQWLLLAGDWAWLSAMPCCSLERVWTDNTAIEKGNPTPAPPSTLDAESIFHPAVTYQLFGMDVKLHDSKRWLCIKCMAEILVEQMLLFPSNLWRFSSYAAFYNLLCELFR